MQVCLMQVQCSLPLMWELVGKGRVAHGKLQDFIQNTTTPPKLSFEIALFWSCSTAAPTGVQLAHAFIFLWQPSCLVGLPLPWDTMGFPLCSRQCSKHSTFSAKIYKIFHRNFHFFKTSFGPKFLTPSDRFLGGSHSSVLILTLSPIWVCSTKLQNDRNMPLPKCRLPLCCQHVHLTFTSL